MRSWLMIVVVSALLAGGCTYQTEHGPCVGVFDDKRPDRIYKLNVENVFWGIVGFELIFPPMKVLADATYCPVARVGAHE